MLKFVLIGKGKYKDFWFARKRLGAVAPLPWVAEMTEFSRNFLLSLGWMGSGWGLSIASLAGAESAGDCHMKSRQRFSKPLKDLG